VEGKVVRSRKVQRVELHRLVFAVQKKKSVDTSTVTPSRAHIIPVSLHARPVSRLFVLPPSIASVVPPVPIACPTHPSSVRHTKRHRVVHATCIIIIIIINPSFVRSRTTYLSTGTLKLCCVGAMMRVCYRNIQSNTRMRRRQCVRGMHARVDKCRSACMNECSICKKRCAFFFSTQNKRARARTKTKDNDAYDDNNKKNQILNFILVFTRTLRSRTRHFNLKLDRVVKP
jgi:hypothetical protein